jgi:HD-GYP domain-containing protein (c-di-GMP phosphodiesterase class II)
LVEPTPSVMPVGNIITSLAGEPLRLRQWSQEILYLRSTVVCSFNRLLELKDLDSGVHSTRLAEWAVRVAKRLDLDQAYQRDVEAAALLHDIGKIGVPDSILRKPGPLTRHERLIINKHPEYGWNALHFLPGFERISQFVLHHHERVDGKGYPSGLKGEEIPLGARIVSVTDAFDAMVTDRCYRRGISVNEAFDRLEACSGTQFDPHIVEHFLKLVSSELPEIAHLGEPIPMPHLGLVAAAS